MVISIDVKAVSVIPANATDNKVIIINRGIGGGIAARSWKKIKVIRNTSGGYTLQHAGITETAFTSIDITKDANYHFSFLSFEKGVVKVEPEKTKWDMQWGYSVFQTNFGAGLVPYNFSDLININYLAGVKAAEILTSRVSYADYADSSIANTTFSADRWAIGNNWRSTQPATGVKTDRFYVIKDAAGNVYKIKFISMGVNDGGTRGKPQIEYKLVRQG